MQSRNRTAACGECQCNAGQYIYKGVDDIYGGQRIGSDICGNKDAVNDGIDCVEQRGQVGRDDIF